MGHQGGFSESSATFWENVHGLDIKLTGTYSEWNIEKRLSAEEVLLALKFWHGIRVMKADDEKGMTEEAMSSFRERLLHAHRFDERPLIALVATVELLPTKVWRRALWHYNIDFQSFESCLRRITPEQIIGLRESLDAILHDQAPPCFREGWKNALRRLFNPSWTHLGRLREELPEDRARRYESKGAFAYEFFNIDFGHVLYRHEEDEQKIEGSLATRFLSKKRNANDAGGDFIVNQEDGAYWWMYRVPRSNYVWFPNRDVQLKQAICPGFWYTIFVWLLVLLVSPLASVLTGVEYGSGMSPWLVGLTGIVGAVTPLIILAVVGKYALIQIGRFIEWATELVGVVIDNKYWTSVAVAIGVIFIGSLGGTMLWAVWCVMHPWFYESAFLATYMTAFLFLWVVYMFVKFDELSLQSLVLPILSLPTAIFVFGKVVFDCYEVVWRSLLSTVFFLIGHWLSITLWTVSVVVVAVPFAVVFMLGKWEERVWRGDKEASVRIARLRFIGKVAMGVFVLAGIGTYGYAVAFLVPVTLASAVFGGAILAATIVVFYILIGKYRPECVGMAQMFSKDSEHRRLAALREDYRKILRSISRNEWMRSQVDYGKKAWWLLEFIRSHFGVEDFPKSLLGIDEKGFAVAQEYHRFLLRNGHLSRKDRTEYTLCMLQGIPLCEAQGVIEAWRVRARESAERWMYLYDVTIGRFIVYPLMFVVEIIGKLIHDTHAMWQILNESCPYWMEPKRLDCADRKE